LSPQFDETLTIVKIRREDVSTDSATRQTELRPLRIPVQERARQKREEIRDAALQAFAQSGFRGTDLNTVAKAAGTSAPHILYYFGSKESLVWELVMDANHELHELAERLGKLTAEEALARVPDAGRLIETHPLAATLNAVLLAENLTEGALHEHFQRKVQRSRSRTTVLIRRAQKAGRMRKDADPVAEAADLYAFIEGLVYHHLLDPERVSIEAGLRRYIDRMLDRLKP
jgi:AcrR family transcriptional regulator